MRIHISEIIGPVMVGPSSSHTAGAARIGRMARHLLNEPVSLHDVGSVETLQHSCCHCLKLTPINHVGDLIQNFALFTHVRGIEHSAGKHELPVQSDGFLFESTQVWIHWIINKHQVGLWLHQRG